MKKWTLAAAATLALAAAGPLAAQDVHLGLALNVGIPTGAFASTTYDGGVKETYDAALGVQFTASFPVDRTLAFRLDLSGTTFSGHVDDPLYPRYNTQNAMFSLGGEAQIFLGDGNAQRHLGSYLIGGLSLDMERFSASYDDPSFYSDSTLNKTRMGLVAGFGHSVRYAGRSRWTFEGVFHKTLTSHDTTAGDPPAADFVRLGVGFVF